MSAEGRTLTERLREALGEHQYALSCIHQGHTTSSGYPDHLADVSARVVEAWLGEQRETVAGGLRQSRLPWGTHSDRWGDVEWQAGFWGEAADAALAALRAGIEAEG